MIRLLGFGGVAASMVLAACASPAPGAQVVARNTTPVIKCQTDYETGSHINKKTTCTHDDELENNLWLNSGHASQPLRNTP